MLDNTIARHIFKYFFMFADDYWVNILVERSFWCYQYFSLYSFKISLQDVHWVGLKEKRKK